MEQNKIREITDKQLEAICWRVKNHPKCGYLRLYVSDFREDFLKIEELFGDKMPDWMNSQYANAMIEIRYSGGRWRISPQWKIVNKTPFDTK